MRPALAAGRARALCPLRPLRLAFSRWQRLRVARGEAVEDLWAELGDAAGAEGEDHVAFPGDGGGGGDR